MKFKLPQLRLPKLTVPAALLTPGALNLAAFLGGWALLAVGLSLWYLPAGLVGAGAVLLYVTLFGGGAQE